MGHEEGGLAVRTRSGDAEVEAVASGKLGVGVRGEEFDGVIDAGDGEEGFVGMSYSVEGKE